MNKKTLVIMLIFFLLLFSTVSYAAEEKCVIQHSLWDKLVMLLTGVKIPLCENSQQEIINKQKPTDTLIPSKNLTEPTNTQTNTETQKPITTPTDTLIPSKNLTEPTKYPEYIVSLDIDSFPMPELNKNLETAQLFTNELTQESLHLESKTLTAENCIIPQGKTTCKTTLNWETKNLNVPKVQLRVNGKLVTCTDSNTKQSKETQDWITIVPKIFTLHQATTCDPQATPGKIIGAVKVKGIMEGAPQATITPISQNCTINNNEEACQITLKWETKNINLPSVQIKLNDKTLWACTKSNMPAGQTNESAWLTTIKTTGKWIGTTPSNFTIRPASGCDSNSILGPILDSVSVKGIKNTPAPQEKPNIIFILTDDLDEASMPYLQGIEEQLTNKGTSFTNFYTTNSVCCSSRASFLRGQYSHNHQVYTVKPPQGGWPKFRPLEDSTLGTWLKDDGYTTMYAGKYMNYYATPWAQYSNYVPPGWTEWYGAVAEFYDQFDYLMNENGIHIQYGSNQEDYLTDVLTEKTVDFIQRTDDPFFIFVAPVSPHIAGILEDGTVLPAIPAPRYQNSANLVTLPQSPSYNELDVSDKIEWVKEYPLINDTVRQQLQHEFKESIKSMYAVEDMVDQIIATLEQEGKLDNTYIIFTSDHGYHYGQHRLPRGKRTVYEEDIRVPLIIRGPGIPQGKTVNAITNNNDVAPTIAQLAGANIPGFVDGTSIMPLISTTTQQRTSTLLEHWEQYSGDTPTVASIRTEHYKLNVYSTGETELFDLQNDPYELESKHNDPAYFTIMQELNTRLNQLKTCKGKECIELEKMSISQ